MGRRSQRDDQESHGHRHERLQRLIFEEMNALLRDDVSDPLLQDIRVTAAELSVDYKNVRLRFILCNPEASPDEVAQAEAAFERASSFLRRGLGDALDLKRLPNLRFVYDREAAAQERALQLIDQKV